MTASVPEWPDALRAACDNQICYFATIRRDGTPITHLTNPYPGADGTIDTATGIAYPAKAERARHNPNVGILFSRNGCDLADGALVVHGAAAVRDTDLAANAEKWLSWGLARTPWLYAGLSDQELAKQAWYWTRIWIEVTPLRALGWNATSATEWLRWTSDRSLRPPASDPAPPGRAVSPTLPVEVPADWRVESPAVGEGASAPVLTTVNSSGYPVPVPVLSASRVDEGYDVALDSYASALMTDGPACITWGAQAVFVGVLTRGDGLSRIDVTRRVGDLAPKGANWSIWALHDVMVPRMWAELRRRGYDEPPALPGIARNRPA